LSVAVCFITVTRIFACSGVRTSPFLQTVYFSEQEQREREREKGEDKQEANKQAQKKKMRKRRKEARTKGREHKNLGRQTLTRTVTHANTHSYLTYTLNTHTYAHINSTLKKRKCRSDKQKHSTPTRRT
jgi:hypothetical protein